MRLQVAVYRHTLPAVNIVFATGTGPASQTAKASATIFNLLEDLNDIIPLESSDGEWGLEDYVVEVAATADQEATYECLHYLPLNSVLREDDEIIVRPLGSDDLRAWRRGGRMQITRDGRHLIDGVVFSKPWLKKEKSRPGVTIPPRKRRRLLSDEEESQKENLEPVELMLPALIAAEEVDGDEDEDYDDGTNEHTVALREIFEDADSSEDELSDVDGGEVQLLLEEAAELEGTSDANQLLESQLTARTGLRKRKRQPDNDFNNSDEVSFEGLESPAQSRILQDVSHQFKSIEDNEASETDSLLEESRQREHLKRQANLLDDEVDEESSDEDFSSTSSTSASEDGSSEQGSTSKDADRVGEDSEDDSSDEDFSSATSSTSDDESSGQASHPRKFAKEIKDRSLSSPRAARNGLRESSDTGESTTSSESTDSDDSSSHSASDSRTSSSSSSSGPGGNGNKKASLASKAGRAQPRDGPENTSGTSVGENKAAQSPPGKGSLRTRANNLRVKRRKRLLSLKAQGLLPAHADFGDLARYDGDMASSEASSMQVQYELEAARKRALAQLTDQHSRGSEAQSESKIAQSIELHDGMEHPKEDESPVVPETQHEQDDRERSLPLSLQPIPDVLLKQLLQLDEPERACKWLNICFESADGEMVSQDAVFIAYSRSFGDRTALTGSELLPCVLKVFNRAYVVDPFDSSTPIKGIRPRHSAEEVTAARRGVLNGQPESAAVPSLLSAEPADTTTSYAEPSPDSPLSPSEPPQKRSRLDVSATRRLIFGALGSRNPKTPAQAEAVRAKLAGTVRQPTIPSSVASVETKKQEGIDDTIGSEIDWQDKLVVTAVECQKEGVSYPPPPFPFVQHWHKATKGKHNTAQMERVRSQESKVPQNSEGVTQIQKTTSAVKETENVDSVPESRTVSFDRDDRDGMPIPSDFNALAALDPSMTLPGAVIAFKELEIDMVSLRPHESEYKVARIDSLHDDLIKLILATRYRIQVARSPVEAEPGQKLYSQFVIQSDVEDDGIRDIPYSEMKEPRLIEASNLQVPASHNGNAITGNQPQAETQGFSSQGVADSILRPASEPAGAFSQPDEPIHVPSPRRHEISAMMKEVGFDSGVGEYQLNPDLSGQARDPSAPHSSNEVQDHSALYVEDSLLSHAQANNLSPLFPPQNDSVITADNGNPNNVPSDAAPPNSPAPISPHLTVDYPSISHVEHASDMAEQPNASRDSSSHQDAQRQSPALEADTDLVASEQRVKLHPIETNSALMPESESESDFRGSSQPAEIVDGGVNSDEARDLRPSPRRESFLGAGLDGSFHASDNDFSSNTSDSLPSLQELTSSQKRKIMTSASKAAKKTPPPTTKRNGLRNSRASKVYVLPPLSDENNDAAELPPSKIEVSQARSFNKFPQGTQVVNLTLSKDPVDPGNNDGESELRASRTRSGRLSGGNQGKRTSRVATDGASQQSLGVGQRRLLTAKKTKSFV